MMMKFSKKILTVGIIASSLAFSAQSAFAATIYEQSNNDSYNYAQVISQYGNDTIVGNLSSSSDRDWYTFTTQPSDAGRRIYVVLNNPTGYHADFVMNKGTGSTFDKTWMSFGNDNVGLYFTAEGSTRYNIVISPAGTDDPSSNYYLNVTIQ
ncbi:hypothetical protein GCM10008018_00130 [Paenibacillus marchantiophytorum]|uniref:Uncharacterized protein n=1 Tax=Paenibacillus marchantiophytorum TaxID=1619310 RepID=A0ABQ2BM96_9BACL|nr:hypothetical protein [Paenibacillus marchantiophytorum]GGI43054.1 hypothetical protein GCM10008018_00130 [Paenibacillus marchantiophytorum]